MKVNLIKEANYDLNESKSSKIPFDTFLKMCCATMDGKQPISSLTEELPNVRIFASIEEFKELPKTCMDKFDTNKNVYILSNGNFCVFLKKDNDKYAVIEKVEKNVTTSTKKNTENEATDLV